MAKGKPISALPDFDYIKPNDLIYGAEELPGPVFGPGSSKRAQANESIMPKVFQINILAGNDVDFDLSAVKGDAILMVTMAGNTGTDQLRLLNTLNIGRQLAIVNVTQARTFTCNVVSFPAHQSLSIGGFECYTLQSDGTRMFKKGCTDGAHFSPNAVIHSISTLGLAAGMEVDGSVRPASVRKQTDLLGDVNATFLDITGDVVGDALGTNGVKVYRKIFTTSGSSNLDEDDVVYLLGLDRATFYNPVGLGAMMPNEWLNHAPSVIQNGLGKYSSLLSALSGRFLDVIGHGFYTEELETGAFDVVDTDDATTQVRGEMLADPDTGNVFVTGGDATPGGDNYVLRYSPDQLGAINPTPDKTLVDNDGQDILSVVKSKSGRILAGFGPTTGNDSYVRWTNDNGDSWAAGDKSNTFGGALRAMLALPNGHVLAFCQSGSDFTCFRSTDDGANFSQIGSLAAVDVAQKTKPLYASDGKIYVGGLGGDVHTSADLGATWATRSGKVGGSGPVYAIAEVPGEPGATASDVRLLAGGASGLWTSDDGFVSSQATGGSLVDDNILRILVSSSGTIYVGKEYFASPDYTVEIYKAPKFGEDFELFEDYPDNKRFGDLVQSALDNTIYASLGGDASPVLLSLDTEILKATGKGRPIRIRMIDGEYQISIAPGESYEAGDRVIFDSFTFSARRGAFRLPRIAEAIAPGDAKVGEIFANSSDNGAYYFVDADGSAKPLAGGSMAPSEVGNFTEATSGSFNLAPNNGYAMELYTRDGGTIGAFQFEIGPNPLGADTTIQVGIHQSDFDLVASFQTIIPAGAVGIWTVIIPAVTAMDIFKRQKYYASMLNVSGDIIEIAKSFTTSTNYGYFFSGSSIPDPLPTANATNRQWWIAVS